MHVLFKNSKVEGDKLTLAFSCHSVCQMRHDGDEEKERSASEVASEVVCDQWKPQAKRSVL